MLVSNSPSDYSWLISFRSDWLDLAHERYTVLYYKVDFVLVDLAQL